MLELDTRQLATIIWFTISISALALWPQTRRAARPALKDVFRTMATWKIIVPFVTYFACATLAIFILQELGVWRQELLIDALTIIFFVSLPMFLNANSEESGQELLRKVLRETIGVAALIAFYVGLAPLSLAGELILQPIVGALTLFSVIASFDIKNKSVHRLANGLLVAFSAWLVLRTITVITETWHIEDVSSSFEKLILSITLPLLLLPIIYVFALAMRYETIFLVSKNFTANRSVPWFAYVAIFVELNFQLGPLNNLGGIWLQKVVESSNYNEARGVLKNLKKAYRQQKRKEKQRVKRLRKMRDKTGTDQDGLQLDRREFYESKHDLENLLYAQMGQFRNVHKHYNPNLPIQLGFSRLPAEHGIAMKVRKDMKSWYAWRQMPNGYYFGVGGSPNVDDVWLYDGLSKPSSFPVEKSDGWHNKQAGSGSTEWRHSDESPKIEVSEGYLR